MFKHEEKPEFAFAKLFGSPSDWSTHPERRHYSMLTEAELSLPVSWRKRLFYGQMAQAVSSI